MTEITKFPKPKRAPEPDGHERRLSDLEPITREQLAEALGHLGDAATLIGRNVVHYKELTIISHLKDIEETLLETLPGGELFERCEACATPLGPHDNFTTYQDGVYVCCECEPTNPQPK
ncbi:hypothetical protein [Maritalea porphyrae]|uniref:hypothetical protein n=1 Tax=Maritalea porphyrae TaxID=880732 RepID=UPI0022B00C7A|nr:hypothetical protein [Maritalea porphyrae]MCZ4270761.1 hypothetical protein [Maritalea porphyrae]